MSTPPREDNYRFSFPGPELRVDEDAEERGGMPTMTGHFAVFNQWTHIQSRWEGNFLERFSPGSLTKTFAENGDRMKVMFQHGKDPQIGEKLLGVPSLVREDGDVGGYYEVPLFDTTYNRDLLPGLEANVYGASMRFTSLREDFNDKAGVSTWNPDGLPERTIKEARIAEFGPVVWPAYAGATAGVRSLTDFVHDVDAVTTATPILLDDERLSHARAFISRGLPPDVDEERKDYSADARKQMAKNGHALPDGSFPIATVADLQNAISAFGRASNPVAAKAHILKRARALGRTDLIPDGWKTGMNSAEPDGTDSYSTDAPADHDAEPSRAHLSTARRGTATSTRWWKSDERKVPTSWE
jgi:phage head maturation protease